ncbi:type III effector protein [Streptomyces sp. SL13]|uniref:Type III effector protein n=1 Tax=Streptantibioticus silvisoli TaxID=2705255 RepID=A0AA90KHM3_9ACTN|nr:type III effector protein [Streptantibioticus silvisoli]MDI5965384.1 type III effector protein [Streptantibioticus silvisoli]MDI5972030.1 type III effector protein [Streptantibioticus silvisoli]
MPKGDQPAPAGIPDSDPVGFLAAEAALGAMDEALRGARLRPPGTPPGDEGTGAEQALAALLLLREVRERLAAWEPDLIEAAREAGASWADLAHPLGVASRQAAERRYLRVRPGRPGSTGEDRVRATRDSRAADRSVTAWARVNSADLRRLAGQITALTDLADEAAVSLAHLSGALADDDASALVAPLADTHTHLRASHPDLAARVDSVTRQAEHLRHDSSEQRRNG